MYTKKYKANDTIVSAMMVKNTRILGNKGEDIACRYLRGKGFTIVARNYLKKWGELDIVAERFEDKKGKSRQQKDLKMRVVHFFEVKSILVDFHGENKSGKGGSADHRPEDNVHGLKTKRLRRMIETYLEEEVGDMSQEFQFHVLCVYMDAYSRRASVKWLKNIII